MKGVAAKARCDQRRIRECDEAKPKRMMTCVILFVQSDGHAVAPAPLAVVMPSLRERADK